MTVNRLSCFGDIFCGMDSDNSTMTLLIGENDEIVSYIGTLNYKLE